ncbi:MAG: MBL fold metallo-hydrolase [Candidatus Bathyarchaeota archaeon]
MQKQSTIKEVDRAEIISLIDNTVDTISPIGRKEVKNFREWISFNRHFSLPFAEHGLSVLVKLFVKNTVHTILFDTGFSSLGVVTNAKRMGIKLTDIEHIVLSHGHYDHFGGLVKITKNIGKKELPIIVHQDALKIRGKKIQDGSFTEYPRFPEETNVMGKFLKIKHSTLFCNSMFLVTGEIERKTNFEKGLLNNFVFSNGKWVPDPWILDDQALILNVKNKGLIVVSGCAHAGIINTIRFAQKITGAKKIFSIIGGFHLGKDENRIKQTAEIIKQINPELIAPMHCTSWQAKCVFSKIIPHVFVWNSIGNLYRL